MAAVAVVGKMALNIKEETLTAQMLEKAKLDWIHIPVSIILFLIFIGQVYFIYFTVQSTYISGKDIFSMLTITMPITYFVILSIKYKKLKQDIENGIVHIKSGTVTGKKETSSGTGKSRTWLFWLYIEDEPVLVQKSFYKKVQNGDFVQVGTLPLSNITVLESNQINTQKII